MSLKAIVMIEVALAKPSGRQCSVDCARCESTSEEIDGLPRALLLHLYARGLNTEVCICIMLLFIYE